MTHSMTGNTLGVSVFMCPRIQRKDTSSTLNSTTINAVATDKNNTQEDINSAVFMLWQGISWRAWCRKIEMTIDSFSLNFA